MTSALRGSGRNVLRALIVGGILVLAGCRSNDPSASNVDATGSNKPIGNSAPSINGAPLTSIAIGEQYSFQPDASDPDGDALTFNIQRKPAWANFDSATGTLSGTPQSGDEGPYDDISIEVSDGELTDDLAFTVTVNQIAMGSVTLSWTAPTQNTDGSALEDLAGYRIYYGVTEGAYTQEIDIGNPGIVTYVVDNLSPNTYYFVATAVNNIGIESDFSGVASTTVN